MEEKKEPSPELDPEPDPEPIPLATTSEDPLIIGTHELPQSSIMETNCTEQTLLDDTTIDSLNASGTLREGEVILSDKSQDAILPAVGLFSEVDVIDILHKKSKMAESTAETEPEMDDKEPKVVNRELKSLIDSAKESKIINEFTQTKTKMRKSKQLDLSTSSLSSPTDTEKIQPSRRSSNNSAVSNSSDLSDKNSQKRSMRSLNPEFVYKNKKFLSTLTGRIRKEEGPHNVTSSDYSDDEEATKNESFGKSPALIEKKSKPSEKEKISSTKMRSDEYCWRCHWLIEANSTTVVAARCTVCPRSYHPKCLGSDRAKACISEPASWVCPECMTVLHAENTDTRSPALQRVPVSMLCALLKHALKRMMEVNGVEPFLYPVDRTQFPDYDKHVVRPMDLSLVQQNIAAGLYGSTEAFLADVLWILHNTFIFNTYFHSLNVSTAAQSRLTGAARSLVRAARIEMGEVEACPECYAAAHARRPTWFTDVCSTPHLLLWAKLKGFPYWPAKGMSVSGAGMVDVRFFGAHDRAWVPTRDCFLYSEKDPNNYRTKRQDIMDSVQEVEQHIRNISRKFGPFVHAPYRTQFEPSKQAEQLRMMVPGYQGTVPWPKAAKEASVSSNTSSPVTSKPKRPRTKSKDPKEFDSDGSCSEEDVPLASQRRKMADGAEIAGEEEESSSEHDKQEKTLDVDISLTPEKNPERGKKRRKSDLEEAVITVLEKSEKRARRSSSIGVQLVQAVLEVLPDKDNNKKTEAHDKRIVETKADDANNSVRKLNSSKTETDNQDAKKNENKQEEKAKPKDRPKENSESILIREYRKIFPHTKDDSSKINECVSNNNVNQKTYDENHSGEDKIKEVKNNKAELTRKSENTKPKVANEINEIAADNTPSPKAIQDRILFSDDVDARGKKSAEAGQLPTISNVCSLSLQSNASPEKPTSAEKSTPVAVSNVEANSDSSVFKASEAQAASLKDAKAKLQRLRNAVEQPPPRTSPRVNVRPFARSKSPIEMVQIDVEIKAEPMDFDDSAKSASDKNDLLSSLNLRPTNAADVEPCQTWNEVIRLPKPVRKVTVDPNERPRARKTFPQPRRNSPQAEEVRMELNGKNSMVYIPIQPATSAAPLRMVRPPHRTNGPASTSNPQRTSTVTASVPPLPPSSVSAPPLPLVLTSSSAATVSRAGGAGATTTLAAARPPAPSVTNMIPVISTVNGQWTFLQPINMETNETLMVNGTGERTSPDITTNNINRPATLTPINTSTSNNSSSNSANSTNREPPPLTPRPGHPLDPSTPIGPMPTPSIAGPVTAQLNQSAVKLTDYFRKMLTDSLEVLEDPVAAVAALKLQMESATWKHKQELAELKHNADLQVLEMRASLEKEKARALSEARRVWEQDLFNTVNLAKSKQWCANCRQEAQFYCCWNTSYCDYSCQRVHWAQHYAACTQQRAQEGSPSATDEPGQLAAGRAHDAELTTSTVSTGAGGKSVPARVYGSAVRAAVSQAATLTMNAPGASAGAASGLARLAAPRFTQQSSFIINKQNTEETVAKITPGGYLIVGASSSGQPAVMSHNSKTTPA